MFNRLALHEYSRTSEGRGSTLTPPSSASSMAPPRPRRSEDSATSIVLPRSRDCRGSSGVAFQGSNSRASDRDYVPKTPPSSSDDCGYAYDPRNIR